MADETAARPEPTGTAGPGIAGIKAMAADFHGVALDDARAAAIAAEIGAFEAGLRAMGPAPLDAAPGALFRQYLLGAAAVARA